MQADGSSHIEDARQIDAPRREHFLNADETTLYLFLDSGIKETLLESSFGRAHPEAAERLGRQAGVTAVVEQWLRDDLVLSVDGRVVALALHSERTGADQSEPNPPGLGLETDTGPFISSGEMRPILQTTEQ